MKTQAFAKINLYLDVTARRVDGYHDILSVMQAVDLCDEITVHTYPGAGEIVLRCDGNLPCDARNLAYRAASAYFADEIPCRIEIDVQKRIPMQAGLAGGSADCAAVLRLLNDQFARYSDSELLALGARLGADVPFCLVGGTRITRGIGELMQPCPPMPDCHFVIARGGEGISTPWAYGSLDAMYGDFEGRADTSEQRLAKMIDAMQAGDLAALTDRMYNVFESVVLPVHPVANALKSQMLAGGAVGALMSGSGPSVVGFFTDADAAQFMCDKIVAQGIAAFVCKPIN